MKKTIFALSTTLMFVVALGTTPTAAFADEDLAAASDQQMGTVESNAVTGPIEVGGITYVPCASTCGRSNISGASFAELEDSTYIPDVS